MKFVRSQSRHFYMSLKLLPKEVIRTVDIHINISSSLYSLN